jgi:hypothetical protein
MEARPHPLAERLVAGLLPPACREHVLGDLHERYVSTGQYVRDAILTVPFAVWGQVRRTTSAMSAVAQAGAVYVAFLAASAGVGLGPVEPGLASAGAGLAALSALVVVALRDAWAGRGAQPTTRLVLDAVLGMTAAAVVHAILQTFDARVAFAPAAVSFACATGLPLLGGVRVILSRLPNSAVSITEGGGTMRATQPGQLRGMQRDLRVWWGTIAALGFTVGVGLLLVPTVAPVRPLVVAWLVIFGLIGVYQRSKTTWPQPPSAAGQADEIGRYRAALERRRDEQYRWPARQLRWLVGAVAMVFLVGVVGIRNPRSAVTTTPLVTSLAVAMVGLGLYAFTRKMTARAAADFQRALDQLPPSGRGEL